MTRKLLIVTIASLVISIPLAAPKPLQSPFAFCKPEAFANCTKAWCWPKLDGSGFICPCAADTRYSAVAKDPGCVAPTASTLQSRYHPSRAIRCATSRESRITTGPGVSA